MAVQVAGVTEVLVDGVMTHHEIATGSPTSELRVKGKDLTAVMDLLPLDETTEPVQTSRLEQLLILDQALTDLGKLDERLAQVVEMRYFGGLSELEIADVLKVTERTVRRDWRKARAFLFSHLGEGELPEPW